ncbi:arginine and glutamate-rich protein 1-B-like isoform X2 [Nerophis ophidion]|uniref:arginine and glutamate-rich protein 1-B-like isoform X2 n=1 Tax=Nerophis ophidion TaxID=159077 RepID=UPI002ADF2A03|nr:arginine and glutamate-rich protein 1-B-like isoform X2 [Nerophis ophidion]
MTSQQQQSSLNLRMGLRKRGSRKRRHPDFITSASLPLEPVFDTSSYRRGSSSRRRSKSRSLSMSPSMSTSRSLSISTSKSRSRSGSKDRSRSKHKRARSTSRDKSRNKHQYTTSTKDDDPKFPMEEGKFQKRVFFLLMDMRATISDLGKKYEPVDSQFHVEMINRRKGLAQLEQKLADGDDRKLLTSRLRKIGVSSLEDNVKNVMKRCYSTNQPVSH